MICDQCHSEFERKSFPSGAHRKFHFCTRACFHASTRCGGILFIERISISLARHGVQHPTQAVAIKERTMLTCIERFGVSNVMHNDDIKRKFNYVEITKRRHATMKRNNTHGKSRIEDQFAVVLQEKFGNVQRHVRMNGWSIDFYVEKIDAYVQLDGVYWHGLDRQIEVIAEHRTKRDAVIHRTWLRDREQCDWFRDHELRLFRVTDKAFKRGLEFESWN